jgi:hypothetical protein
MNNSIQIPKNVVTYKYNVNDTQLMEQIKDFRNNFKDLPCCDYSFFRNHLSHVETMSILELMKSTGITLKDLEAYHCEIRPRPGPDTFILYEGHQSYEYLSHIIKRLGDMRAINCTPSRYASYANMYNSHEKAVNILNTLYDNGVDSSTFLIFKWQSDFFL